MIRKILGSTLMLVLFITQVSGQNSNQQIYLSGKSFDDTKTWDFFCSEGNNSGVWSKIEVPSQWEQQGFGEYTYGRWYKQRGKSPSMETGHYKTTFNAPQTWENKVINIVFEGVMTDTEVHINGIQAGEIHQGGFYRFSYNISDKLKLGEQNILEVFVKKHSDDNSVNAAERKADWWLFGGIYRPVYLDVKPAEHISQIKVDARANGSLTTEVYTTPLNSATEIRCSLKDLYGNEFSSFNTKTDENSTLTILENKWENISAWNPETPHLYLLNIELIRGKEILHTISERIGFRTIEVRPQDGIYCNGTKILMKGVNRHTFWPESGRCTSKEISLLDARLIKEMNMNAVRCHYPPDEHFLDACDSLGLFFIDELAGWQNAYRTSIGSKLVKELVNRDVNHPSVIIWSNGNEGGWNYDIDPLFKELDPQKRNVIHPWADYGDIDVHHYPQYQTGVHRLTNGYKIFMPTEFLHGLYDEGHGAGLEDFWTQYKNHPLCAGGFLWAFNDGAIKRTDLQDSLDSDGQHAPDGIVGPYREKEGSFYSIKEIWSPIQFEKKYITKSFNGEFRITNEYLFTNLNTCSMNYTVHSISGPWDLNTESKQIASGSIELSSIEPGETRKIKFDLPKNFFEGDVLSITAKNKNGNELYTWRWPIHYAAEYLALKDIKTASKGKAQFDQNDATVTLKAAGTEIIFDGKTGLVKNIKTPAGTSSLKGGPVPVGMKAEADHFAVRKENEKAVFTVWYKGGIDSIRWEMHPDGRLKMSMLALNKATNDGGFDGGYIADEISLWGLTFNLDETEIEGMEWLGKGPYRVWKNRQKGTSFNLWEKAYNNTVTGETFGNLQYPEFKGYHANTYWAKLKTKKKNTITLATESDGLYLHILTPPEPEGSLRQSIPTFPEGDLSFLYEINSIRAFKPVSQMGPNSAPSSIRIKSGDEGVSMVVWFNFNE